MNPVKHKIFITTLVLIGVGIFVYLMADGYSYYRLSIEDRFFNDHHKTLKPSGAWGHGFGIIGSFLMLIGVSMYMIRKRVRRFSRIGIMKHWLEIHIFLCTIGPMLVLFHTAFKFGGLVAISFWSMVAVVLSGVIGRYIYLQIPRTIEGRELSMNELNQQRDDIYSQLTENSILTEETATNILSAVKERPDRSGANILKRAIKKYRFERSVISNIKRELRNQNLSKDDYRRIFYLIKGEISLARKIDRLVTMQSLFQHWHVAHLPFAIIMLAIMIVHVVVTIMFGYKWIF